MSGLNVALQWSNMSKIETIISGIEKFDFDSYASRCLSISQISQQPCDGKSANSAFPGKGSV